MIEEFAKGSTIIVDKPLGFTSFDVVNKLRWNLKQKLGVKKLKVGHAGTLDPLASGVLVICVGQHTKQIESLMAGAKTYTGTILLGKTTPSFDLETEYDGEFPTGHITKEMIKEIQGLFTGEQAQIPPVFSAKQVDGKRAYDLARAGKEVQLKPVMITIEELMLDDSRFPEIDFRVTCSKGTYIRSLANDIGKALNSGGTLISLRRIRSGDQDIANARTLDEWIDFIRNQPL